MGDELILKSLIDDKVLKVLDVFFVDDNKEFYLREISKYANVPVATTYRIINRLVDLKTIEQIKIKKFKLYKLVDNKQTEFLKKILRQEPDVLSIIVGKIKDIKGISHIILHGKVAKSRANILLIGENVNNFDIKQAVVDLKSNYNYTVSSLTLSPEQYENMLSMGLYSGEKKILFKKS